MTGGTWLWRTVRGPGGGRGWRRPRPRKIPPQRLRRPIPTPPRSSHEPVASDCGRVPAGAPLPDAGCTRIVLSLVGRLGLLCLVADDRLHGVGICPGLVLAAPTPTSACYRLHGALALDRA